MNCINCSKPGYTSVTCSKIEHIPYDLIFATRFNESLILITIISNQISQSEYSIHIKLNICLITQVPIINCLRSDI